MDADLSISTRTPELQTLILRSNRYFGASLVEHGLLAQANLETAFEQFNQDLHDAELSQVSILNLLMNDLGSLDEADLLAYQMDTVGLSLIDLDAVKLRPRRKVNVDLSLCWASLTLPFDRMDRSYLLATCYYLSEPVVRYWSELLQENVIWYVTTLDHLSRGITRLEALQEVSESELQTTQLLP